MTENSVNLVDKGGISFLKRIIKDEAIGWESIGNAFGQSTEKLFYRMAEEIQNAQLTNKSYKSRVDPITNEPVDFFVNMKK